MGSGGIPEYEYDDDRDGYVECDREDPLPLNEEGKPEWYGEFVDGERGEGGGFALSVVAVVEDFEGAAAGGEFVYAVCLFFVGFLLEGDLGTGGCGQRNKTKATGS